MFIATVIRKNSAPIVFEYIETEPSQVDRYQRMTTGQ